MNIAVAQSGGPTCAINASLLGVIKEALKVQSIGTIYGSVNGIEGIINDHLVDLKTAIRTNEDMELLRQTPSTVLGSCRYKLPDVREDSRVYQTITDCFDRHDIKAFFYIGGNDSMDTVNKLSKYFKEINKDIKVIGVPKTIDNDLCETDHTPGFGSAAKYVALTMQEIARDSTAYSVRSVTVVEIMGRNAGWLTASSAMLHENGESAPHLIYLPETDFSAEKFLDDIRKMHQKYRSLIIAVSEGIDLPMETTGGNYRSGAKDIFGHRYLSGIGKYLENLISREIGCKVRSIELNVMQRCASHIASKTDLEEAGGIAAAGVRAALAGETGKMMCFKRIADMPYAVEYFTVPAGDVANHEKKFPVNWINEDKNGILSPALDYFRPLIQGETYPAMQNGMPVHFKLPIEE